jgi:hypothetical protein
MSKYIYYISNHVNIYKYFIRDYPLYTKIFTLLCTLYIYLELCYVKGKSKCHSITGHEGPEGE